jgi:hypothetical protein
VEQFSIHIEKLLAHHKYGVIPYLGGFVVQQQSAKVLSDRITAPAAIVAFNPLMLHADGMLALEIARSRQISYRMAMEYIDHEVESIQLKLNDFQQVHIGNLGMIVKNETGSLIFDPSEKPAFLPENLGLTDIYVTERTKLLKTESRQVTFTLPSNRTFRYAASILLALGLFVYTERVSDVKTNRSTANLALLGIIQTKQPKPSPATVQPQIPSITEKNPDQKVSAAPRFHVIVASLHTAKTADEVCQSLIGESFEKAHVLSPAKLYRVAIESFNNKKEAISFMMNLRKTDHRFENAWVFCN